MKDAINKKDRAIVAGLTLVMLIGVGVNGFYFSTGSIYLNFPFPWLWARSIMIVEAINFFQTGVLPPDSYLPERAFVMLILFFFIAPLLYLWSTHKLHDRSDGHTAFENRMYKFAWYGSASLSFTLLITVVCLTAVNMTSFSKVKKNADVDRTKDQMRQEMILMAAKAAEIRILPGEYGGGDGSFTLTSGGESRNITLDDLGPVENSTGASFIVLPAETDTLIEIVGVVDKPGEDPDFINTNGDTGKVEIYAHVSPPFEIVIRDRN